MNSAKVTVQLEPSLLAKLDEFVRAHLFRNRSEAVAAAVREKIERLERDHQFRTESQKRDPAEEQTIAEDGVERKQALWDALTTFRQQHKLQTLNISPKVWEGVRDTSPGREVEL